MKYRILTNGDQFKAQIREKIFGIFPYWGTLQKPGRPIFIEEDALFDTYKDAEKAAMSYIDYKTKKERWWIANGSRIHKIC